MHVYTMPAAPFSPGVVRWQSPANIALIKYWGKISPQLPGNPSMSLTLSKAITDMQIAYSTSSEGLQITLTFEGKPNPLFQERIREFLNNHLVDFPFLKQLRLDIITHNTFPHSAGIASSASSMSALALCLMTIAQNLGYAHSPASFYQHASYIARGASGSACRSLYGGMVIWGATEGLPLANDQYATPLDIPIAPIFQGLKDAILVLDTNPKRVSSSKGHARMIGHAFREARFVQARQHLHQLLHALEQGDTDAFATIVEAEALSLHALMMTSTPPIFLFHPNTIRAIAQLNAFRQETRLPICYTLDAGPNIHVLYPVSIRLETEAFINNELRRLCVDEKVILDHVGTGPVQQLPLS